MLWGKSGFQMLALAVLIAAFAPIAIAGVNEDLIAAAVAGPPIDLNVVRQLVNRGADVNFHDQGRGGWTALMYAAHNQEIDVVEFLVGKGADVNAKASDGKSVLMAACDMDSEDPVEHWGDGTGQSYQELVIKLLLDKGAEVNLKDDDGKTALMNASQHGPTDLVSLLLAKGADINAKAKNGDTALAIAYIVTPPSYFARAVRA
jgi:uncharacterized protein